ncbi:MAG: DNA polymerase III subunit beta [bacterium]
MNIECNQEKLIEAISQVEKITGKHMTLPVLSCVFLEAKKNNTLTLKATNLDLGAEVIISAKVHEEGVAAVSPSILGSFVSGLKAGEKGITLKVVQGNLEIKTANTNGTIKTMPHEDFPNIPKIQNGNKFTISAVDFVKGLKSVWYSASVSGIKPELSSVYVYCETGFIVFAATDSFRLAEKKIKMKKEVDFGQILIPFKNISEIVRVLEKVSDEVDVELNKNQISFNHKGFYLVSRVIDGVFPDYRQIIPKDKKTEALVLKQDLLNTLKLSHIFSDKFNQINIKLLPSKGTFEIKTKNSDVGEAVNTIDAEVSGEDIEINFNYRYIADAFQSIDADSITLSFSGLNRPMVVRPVSDASFTYIVMPMNR